MLAELVPTYLEKLNPPQRAAACFGRRGGDGRFEAGPLLVIAGAGTGKTMTLAHRVAHLVVQGVAPERILLLTFTRRAAETMSRRVDSIVRAATKPAGGGATLTLPWSGTFHSIGNRLLRRYAENAGLDPAFSILDRADSADMLDVVRHELGFTRSERRFPKKDTCLAIYSRAVNAREPLEKVLGLYFPWCDDWQDELRRLFRAYVERKQRNQCLDYDDLLLYWRYLVEDREFAADIGGMFDHVLVDEYQDTNLLQAEILKALKPDGRGVTVVGDDAQSIYAFRAAEVGNILDFPKSFARPADVVTLEQNYRSTQAILDAANCLIADGRRQFPKKLFSAGAAGERPELLAVADGDAEAEYVAGAVLERREAGTALRQQAVLFRSSHHSDRLELELVRRNIPYVKYGGLRFLESAHVKDLLAILKWADNPRNEIAAFRVLKLIAGMGPRHASRCFAAVARADHSFGALADYLPPKPAAGDWPAFAALMTGLAAGAGDAGWQSGIGEARRWYRPRLERIYDDAGVRDADLDQLEQVAARYETRERFLTELTLDPPSASGNLSRDALLDDDYLILSTVHSAKGQEWDAVYLLNVTDGNFPNEYATGNAAALDEERRLLYVAMTRARHTLTLMAPLRFFVTRQPADGSRYVHGARSRFLTDAVLKTLRQRSVSRGGGAEAGESPRPARSIDLGSRMRDMW